MNNEKDHKMFKQNSTMSCTSAGLQISLTALNPHFVCVLCFGYFIDATTITECMHTFCKSCIVNFLSTNHHCPHCDTLLSRTRTLTSLRPDRIMQALVYKTVPGLFQTEMRRRINFYDSQPSRPLILSDYRKDVEDQQNFVFSSDDYVSLVLKYNCTTTEENGSAANLCDGRASKYYQRFLRCPATVPVYVLKLLMKTKHHIPDSLRMELLYGEERLLDSWTLMEIAYIFRWTRVTPMELSFQIFAKRKVKKKKLVVRKRLPTPKSTSTSNLKKRSHSETGNSNTASENGEPIKKSPKLIISSSLASPEDHPRPPTPPETPEQILHDDQCSNTQNTENISKKISSKRKNASQAQNGSKEKIYFEDKKSKLYESISMAPIEQKILKSTKKHPDSNYTAAKHKLTSFEMDSHQETEAPGEINMTNTECEDKISEKNCSTLKESNIKTSLNSLIKHSPQVSNNERSNFKEENYTPKSNLSYAKEANSKPKPKNYSSDKNKCKQLNIINAKNLTNNNDSGVLDLSHHARTVRAKRGDDINVPSPSPSPPTSENNGLLSANTDMMLPDSKTTAGQNEKGVSIKNKGMLAHNSLPAPGSMNKLPIGWTRPPMLPNTAAEPQTTAFRDLVTLSHAAVQLQIAMAHAQAQAQVHVHAQKLQENVFKKLKASESLSFINGSGDTLTISPIAGTQINGQKIGNNKSGKNCPKVISRSKPTNMTKPSTKLENHVSTKNGSAKEANKGVVRSPSRKQLLPASIPNKFHKPSTQLTNDNGDQIKFPPKVNSALKFKSLNGCKNKLPTHPAGNPIATNLKSTDIKTIIPKSALSSLKIPIINIHPCKNAENNKVEKDKRMECGRSGDEVFKITNQKLIECLRQQHHNNKLRSSTSPKSSCPDGCISPTKIDTEKTCLFEGIDCVESEQASDSNPKVLTSESSPAEKIPLPISTTTLQNSNTQTTGKQNNTITPLESSSAFKVTNASCFGQTSIINTQRTTNTSVRQIPNPSRLHQQSVSRLSLGSHRPLNNGKRSYASTGDRLESLTRTLHEKVAASAAGIVSPLAR